MRQDTSVELREPLCEVNSFLPLLTEFWDQAQLSRFVWQMHLPQNRLTGLSRFYFDVTFVHLTIFNLM